MDKDKSFWQLFQEWQLVRQKKPCDKVKKEELEKKLGGYLIDTLALRQELFMACRFTPFDEPLREVFLKRLEHTQVLEEEVPHTFDCEGGEFYDMS